MDELVLDPLGNMPMRFYQVSRHDLDTLVSDARCEIDWWPKVSCLCVVQRPFYRAQRHRAFDLNVLPRAHAENGVARTALLHSVAFDRA